jgi:MFS family permease
MGSSRVAATAMFFVAGWLPAAWATRIPSIKATLGLSDGLLAVAILGLEGGALLGLPAGAALVARLGSPRALRAGFSLFAPALVAAGLAPGLPALMAALAAMAFGNSIVDVAMNAQGVELERRRGRALLSGLHAGHPLGLVAGGLAGTAAAAADVPAASHFAIVAVAGLAVALAASTRLLPDRRTGTPRQRVRPTGPLLLLGLAAFCAFGLDGAASNWSAVDLRIEHGAPAALAAAAFTAFALALAAGRVVGDRLVARHGRLRVVRVSALVTAAGGALVALAPGAAAGLAGWAVVGLGLAAVAPTLVGAAPGAVAAPPATAVAAVTSIGYLGSFSGPPLIGGLAEAAGLSTALLVLVAASLLLAALAGPALRADLSAPEHRGAGNSPVTSRSGRVPANPSSAGRRGAGPPT